MFVGVDVSKQSLEVHVRPSGEAFAVGRDEAGLAELVRRLAALAPERVVLEATGGYERAVAAQLACAGLPVCVVNPRQVRDFAKAQGRLEKTDALDAAAIAAFAQAIRPELRPLPAPEQQALAALVARRRQLVEMLVAERLRHGQAQGGPLKKRIAEHIGFLEKSLVRLDRDLDDAVKASPIWRAKEALLTSVPGVGGGFARTLLADMPELGSLGPRQAGKLGGVAPIARDSGKLKGQRRIAGGRAEVRSTGYMATLAAIRCNPVIGAHYRKLRARGKPAKVAIVACLRKLLVILNAMLRDGARWDERKAAHA
jgi:transposase